MAQNSTILNWDASLDSEELTGYKIEKSVDGGVIYNQIGLVGSGVTTYTATEIVDGQETWFRVRAYNNYGNSDYSNEESILCMWIPEIGLRRISPLRRAYPFRRTLGDF